LTPFKQNVSKDKKGANKKQMDMSLVIEQVSNIVIALEPPPQLDHFASLHR